MAGTLDYAAFVGIYMDTRGRKEVSVLELGVAEQVICSVRGESGICALTTRTNYGTVPPRAATPDEYIETLYKDVFKFDGDPNQPFEFARVKLICGSNKLASTYIFLPLEELSQIRKTIRKYSGVIDCEVERLSSPQKKEKAVIQNEFDFGR
jgi:hypothetical protein